MRSLHRAALEAVDPRRAVAAALSVPEVARALRGARRVGVFAAGKAAVGMFRAAWRPGRAGLLVVPSGYPGVRWPGATVLFSAHPEPDVSSVRAARAALRFFSSFGAQDVLLCLVSGGASSLLCLPRRGVGLSEKRRAVGKLVRSGAPIAEVNRLRTSLSAVKGGRLGRATRARLVTLVVSDVPGDRPSLVGSGPTVRGRRGDVTRVVASNRAGLAAAAAEARRLGLTPRIRRRRLEGEAREVGNLLARRAKRLAPGEVLLAGGETTVALGQTAGKGGRNLEVALAAALSIENVSGLALLAVGSDGKDGSSRGAGAVVDGRTIPRARRIGLDPTNSLRRHDTEPFFARLRDLVVTGPTGTNVGDFLFVLRS
ncbi:MAG: glycerate kinase type-2 family protein [Thermoanaerobaculia bacterium]